MEPEEEGEWRELISNYWGLCSQVDTHVGTILETLRECEIYDDTLIVFTADHGDMLGSHRLLQKSFMFHESIMVPLILRMPGQEGSVTIDGPVSHIDLLPTILDIMGEDIPGNLQGKSLRPVLEGEAEIEGGAITEWNSREGPPTLMSFEDEATAAMRDPTRTIVTPDGWRFSCSPMGWHELYNLDDDPMEIHNLARSGEYDDLMSSLLGEIREWQSRTGDRVQLPSPSSRGNR